jgi:hypothetical protein
MINYPVILTNMNRLSTCKKMVDDLFKLNGNSRITIIDNASTYPPLLDWYDTMKNDINIIYNQKNEGPWAFFYGGTFSNIEDEIYIYSDADLELNPNMPYNWQEIMIDYINKYGRKASLVLRIDDIPDSYEFKSNIINHQGVCWYESGETDVYRAITDMTFSMDKKSNGHRYESMRLGGDFACRHIPWYIDFNNISDEEIYYLEHINRGYNEAMYTSLHHDKLELLRDRHK